MSIPTMIVTADSVAQLVGDGVDVGDEVDAVALAGMTFEFICNVKQGTLVPGDGEDVWVVQPVPAIVNSEGVLCRRNPDDGTAAAPGVPLVAAGTIELSESTPLQWRCRPGRIHVNGRWVRPRAWWFNAEPDGTIAPLRSLLPVIGVEAQGIMRGLPGRPVDDFDVIDGDLQFFVDGSPIGEPKPLPSAAWGSIAEKPPVVAAGEDLDEVWSVLGNVPPGKLPNLALVQYKGPKASQAAMLTTSGEPGDWVTRTDTSSTWLITGDDPTQLSSWTQLPTPNVQPAIDTALTTATGRAIAFSIALG